MVRVACVLLAYMHGFFMDMKLYVTLKGHGSSSEPQSYNDWVKAQVKKKIEAKRESISHRYRCIICI